MPFVASCSQPACSRGSSNCSHMANLDQMSVRNAASHPHPAYAPNVSYSVWTPLLSANISFSSAFFPNKVLVQIELWQIPSITHFSEWNQSNDTSKMLSRCENVSINGQTFTGVGGSCVQTDWGGSASPHVDFRFVWSWIN